MTEMIEVVFSKAGIENIANTVSGTNYTTEYEIAKLGKERARKMFLDKNGKIPKFGVPEISKNDDGDLVMIYPITGIFA
jgi:Holliday junction resolvasome RuvABC DNA-binding subunit